MILKLLKILRRTNIEDIKYYRRFECNIHNVESPSWQNYYDEIRIGDNIVLRRFYEYSLRNDYGELNDQFTVEINGAKCLLRGIDPLIYFFAYHIVKKKERLEAKEEKRACKEAIKNAVKNVKNELDKIAI